MLNCHTTNIHTGLCTFILKLCDFYNVKIKLQAYLHIYLSYRKLRTNMLLFVCFTYKHIYIYLYSYIHDAPIYLQRGWVKFKMLQKGKRSFVEASAKYFTFSLMQKDFLTCAKDDRKRDYTTSFTQAPEILVSLFTLKCT